MPAGKIAIGSSLGGVLRKLAYWSDDGTEAGAIVPYVETPGSPSRNCYAVTPHATNPLPTLPKGLYIGTGGDVTLRTVDSEADVVFKNVASGQILDVQALYVRAAGTTATDIVAMA